jgi:hypothetical protein
MTRWFALFSLMLFGAAARAEAPGGGPLPDWHPDPALVPLYRPSLADTGEGGVEQVGEVVILEGDDTIVTDDGKGNLAIDPSGNAGYLTERFFTVYPDQFDEVIFFTTFRDTGSPGALAYEISAQNDVDGICMRRFDNARDGWGAPDGHLHAFVNMMWIDQWSHFDGLPLTDSRSYLYPVLGQEFGHRWLAFLKYKDAGGANSQAMLGRDLAHWACTLQSDASVFDGMRWNDNGDGTFTVAESNARYSKLDLYAMGLLPADQVPPWYLIQNAVSLKTGMKIDPASQLNVGAKVRGNRENITIDQVVAACGARSPAFGASPKSFRAAFVLVTRPGERAADVVEKAELLEIVRKNWEQAFSDFTGGLGSVCTQVSAPCGSPVARIVGGTVREAGGNGNGVIEPGEPIDVTFHLLNDGVGATGPVSVTATSSGATFPQPVSVASIAEGGGAEAVVRGTLASDGTTCGQPLLVQAAATADGNTWRGFTEFTPGTRLLRDDRFDGDGGLWGANLDGADTAPSDGFELGVPQGYTYHGSYQLQPTGGRGGSGEAWFTGVARGSFRNGSTHGLGVGTSSLWSPWMDLSHALRPKVRYAGWFVGLDVSMPNQAPSTAPEDFLILRVSNDGLLWAKVDQLDGADDRWRQREIDLTPLKVAGRIDLSKPILFRFTVNRESDLELVEAGVDDFQIVSDTDACMPMAPPDMGVVPPPPDSGCAIAARPAGAPLALALALLALLARAMRRRPKV